MSPSQNFSRENRGQHHRHGKQNPVEIAPCHAKAPYFQWQWLGLLKNRGQLAAKPIGTVVRNENKTH
jgi:hypothetical protein